MKNRDDAFHGGLVCLDVGHRCLTAPLAFDISSLKPEKRQRLNVTLRQAQRQTDTEDNKLQWSERSQQ